MLWIWTHDTTLAGNHAARRGVPVEVRATKTRARMFSMPCFLSQSHSLRLFALSLHVCRDADEENFITLGY